MEKPSSYSPSRRDDVMGMGTCQILLLSALLLQTVRACVLVSPLQGYYVVAVVKKSDVGITWNSLRGKKSCHTAVGTSAGWTIPLGLIYNQTGSCKFGKCVLKVKPLLGLVLEFPGAGRGREFSSVDQGVKGLTDRR